MYNDGSYHGYAPPAPQFSSIQQFNSYDFQGAAGFAPSAPTFSACPAPPGMVDGWIAPPTIQPEESEEEKLKREGKKTELMIANCSS